MSALQFHALSSLVHLTLKTHVQKLVLGDTVWTVVIITVGHFSDGMLAWDAGY